MFGNDNTVLVIGAHPDDEVLGAGGAIAKHSNADDDVHILIVSEGSTQQYDDPDLIVEKREHAHTCADRLGASAVHFGGLPDMRLSDIAHVDINETIESVCADINPDVVYTHSRREVNRDHVAVHDSTLVATRPGSGVSTVLSYETPSSTDFSPDLDGFEPNMFVDISDQIECKIDAFNAYKTEIREYPHPRSPEALRAIARARGASSGFEFAEAFDVLRMYR
ncbi:PIG-L deacetylase family protein [Natrinema salsiterrestre]|uniref:PIG-L family deacetylase n=1 Tax=Natrinema salsiterrestre TaxID=2950540 RepID=A0A9Q4L4M0_9EURY|nr:PIG-L deacetylase family protein [Natrinema salsiterrestre]MDF9745850.1 PIG-L family deacetylase [Natrinema salsiterrestre]